MRAFAVLFLGLVVTVNAISEQCGTKCDRSYSEDNLNGRLKEPCKRGCRLFAIHDATRHVDPFFPFDIKQFGLGNRVDESLNKCNKDCSEAYENKEAAFANACIQGCKNEQDADGAQIKFGIDDGLKDGLSFSFGNPGLFNFNSNIFDDVDRMLARTRGNIPSFMRFSNSDDRSDANTKDKQVAGNEGSSAFHSMFDSVHRNVQNLMQNVLDQFNDHIIKEQKTNEKDSKKEEIEAHRDDVFGDGNSEMNKLQGGKLVVIQDGPGYHNEKTYNFGPKADVGKIFNKEMNDMMDHKNPLENFFKNDDVEIIDPFKTSKSNLAKSEEVSGNKNNAFDVEVFGPFTSDDLKDTPEDRAGKENDIELNFDEWNVGPKLPDTGLKSRPLPIFTERDGNSNNIGRLNIIVGDRSYENVCAQDSRQMKWSDWVSCLHTRLGLPRWLMAATVCLGIIFTLWICLVIPTNAPKQRVRKSQKSVHTKELEANGIVNPHLAILDVQKAYPLDLPPSYDDVTKIKVNLVPVHETKAISVNEESNAEPLPEKSALADESQA